jgi:hypothetical protein
MKTTEDSFPKADLAMKTAKQLAEKTTEDSSPKVNSITDVAKKTTVDSSPNVSSSTVVAKKGHLNHEQLVRGGFWFAFYGWEPRNTSIRRW